VTHRFPRLILAVNALLFLALGVWFTLSPDGLTSVGLDPTTADARAELRATYGGFELGVGAFLAWCTLGDARRLSAGLLAAACAIGGFGVGRAVGIVVDGPELPIFWALLAVEAAGVTVSLLARWRLGAPHGEEPAASAEATPAPEPAA
jgi:hypothetical protein